MSDPLPMILHGASNMMFVDADIAAVSRDRDFGRVEATVTLYVKQPGSPLRPLRIRANVADRGPLPLRARLVADAAALAEHFMAQPDHVVADRAA